DIRTPAGQADPVMNNYEVHKTSLESPRSHKLCIALVHNSVIGSKNGESSDSLIRISRCSFSFARSTFHTFHRHAKQRLRESQNQRSTPVALIGHCALVPLSRRSAIII